MRLIVTDPSHFDQRAGEELSRILREARPPSSIAVPTGSTPQGLYRWLAEQYALGHRLLAGWHIFMLDEYVDLATYPEGSFQDYLRHHLAAVLADAAAFHPLDPVLHAAEPWRYDDAIDAVGGLRVAVLGVGGNGHVAFNEPGSHDDERTHVVTLSELTREANFCDLPPAMRPTRAVTVGLGDLRRAQSLLLLIAGETKRAVAQLVLDGARLDDVPVTHLLDHPGLVVVLDEGLVARRR